MLNLTIVHALPAAMFFFPHTALSWISHCFFFFFFLFLYIVLHNSKTKHSRRDTGVFSQKRIHGKTGTDRSYEMMGILPEPEISSCFLNREAFNIFR